MCIGKRIKERRIELGLTQKDLATKVGYSTHSTIVRVENGESEVMQSMIPKYADALQCSIPYLFGMEDSVYDLPYDEKEKELLEIARNVGIDQLLIYARFLKDTKQ